ncbi:diguanylate cyclase domain-containing protein [Fundidesulfovibrio agrisoli]|uniref:diguanylate cyclase domain-containing protein n=1 Tax=Fundidesulfovibrio agrisoli TaxID=2922717 RepID=UPI001FAC39B8|nr:diguanylate cyclase [Fundidesulfovibrio agrisoli]
MTSSTIATLRECMRLTFPPVMLQLLEEAVKPTPDFDVLARIMALDPVLTATVLTLANSPYYGSAQKVTDLQRAATILGTREILKIALSVTYQKHLSVALTERGIDFYANWRIIIWAAIAAELLAERLCPETADQVYLSALLKDISLLLMACHEPENFARPEGGPPLTSLAQGQLEDERERWVADHCQLTTMLLREWNIPLQDPKCIMHHHDLEGIDAHSAPTQCVILATRWAELEIGAHHPPAEVVHFRSFLLRRLGLSQEELDEVHSRCIQRFQTVLSTLGIDESPPDERYYQHGIRQMQEFHFLASEIATAAGGKLDAARIIGRHLKWEWGVDEWELALGVPEYRDWDLFRASKSDGVACVQHGEKFEELSWSLSHGAHFPIVARDVHLGELRLSKRGLRGDVLKEVALYVSFASQNYEQYALRQTVLELKAHTLDQLPVGVARLSPKGAILEINNRLRDFLAVPGVERGADLWTSLGEGKGFSRDGQWDTFLRDASARSLHKIFCLWQGEHQAHDSCVYLAAEKRTWQGREEILLFLEDVSLVSGWEFKALKQGEFLEKLVGSMRDKVFTIDVSGRITFASPRAIDLLGRNLFDCATPTHSFQGDWGPQMLAGAPAPVETVLPSLGAAGRTLELVFSPLPSASGGMRQWLVVGRDITAVRRLEEKLKRMALFDGLTGLLNHYQFHVVLEREVNRSRRTGRSLGLIFFDLDNFKAVNDNLGHQAGDEVLRTVARILKARLRKGMDYPCRYGGDEFAVVVTEIEPDQLEHLAGRVLAAVKEEFKGVLGLSIGMAMLKDDELPSALLRRTDQASYQAKNQGGHRILWA